MNDCMLTSSRLIKPLMWLLTNCNEFCTFIQVSEWCHFQMNEILTLEMINSTDKLTFLLFSFCCIYLKDMRIYFMDAEFTSMLSPGEYLDYTFVSRVIIVFYEGIFRFLLKALLILVLLLRFIMQILLSKWVYTTRWPILESEKLDENQPNRTIVVFIMLVRF